MAVYKEEKTNTWRVVYRFVDWTGEKKQTQKYYLKSRGKDVKPKNVSQGERNIIALCYFFLQIASNLSRLHNRRR